MLNWFGNGFVANKESGSNLIKTPARWFDRHQTDGIWLRMVINTSQAQWSQTTPNVDCMRIAMCRVHVQGLVQQHTSRKRSWKGSQECFAEGSEKVCCSCFEREAGLWEGFIEGVLTWGFPEVTEKGEIRLFAEHDPPDVHPTWNWRNESSHLYHSGPLLEICPWQPEDRYGRYGFASLSSIPLSIAGVDGPGVSLWRFSFRRSLLI